MFEQDSYKSESNSYDSKSYFDFGFAGEVTSLYWFDVMNCI